MELLSILHPRLFENKSKLVEFETRELILIFWTIKRPQVKQLLTIKF